MIDATIAAYIFCFLISVVIIFQLGLALGAPWGEMAMGGKFPGRLPVQMRIAAIVQIFVLMLVEFVVFTRAGLGSKEYIEFSESAIWPVVVFCVVGVILNVITPSKKERALWAPVTVVLLICSVIVATS